MKNSQYIYALTDPDGRIRYIGRSKNPQRRLVEQLRDPTSLNMRMWLDDLMDRGLKPGVRVLREVSDREAPSVEKTMIRRLAKSGLLVNVEWLQFSRNEYEIRRLKKEYSLKRVVADRRATKGSAA